MGFNDVKAFVESARVLIDVYPGPFLASLALALVLGWAFGKFAGRTRLSTKDCTIENQRSEISLLDRQIDQFRTDNKTLQNQLRTVRPSVDPNVRLVESWDDSLKQTFFQLVRGDKIEITLHPDTAKRLGESADASYLLSLGLAEKTGEVTIPGVVRIRASTRAADVARQLAPHLAATSGLVKPVPFNGMDRYTTDDDEPK